MNLFYNKKFIGLLFIWMTVSLLLTLFPISSIKFPNDGVYYFSMAQSLLKSGVLQDISTLPPRDVASSQNGIVFIIAFFYYCFGSYWLIPFALIVGSMWAIGLSQIYLLMRSMGVDKKLSLGISLILCLQQEILLANLSFYNEAIYMPAFYGCVSYAIRHYILDENQPRSRIGNGLVIVFLIFGALFRVQHITMLLTIFIFTFFVKKQWRLKVMGLLFLAGGIFVLNAMTSVWGLRTESLSNQWHEIFSLDFCRFVFVISQFIFFLFPDKFFPLCSTQVLVSSIFGFMLFLWIFKKCYTLYRNVFLFIGPYLLINAPMLYLMPLSDGRYALTQRFMIAIVLSTFFSTCFHKDQRLSQTLQTFNQNNEALKKIRWPIVSVIVVIVLFCSGLAVSTYRYLSSQAQFYATRSKVFSQLRVHDSFKQKIPVDDYLIYSIAPHLTYWRLNKSVCESPPELCAFSANLPFSNKIYFFGKAEDFPSGMLKGYKLDKALTPLLDGFAFWNVIPL